MDITRSGADWRVVATAREHAIRNLTEAEAAGDWHDRDSRCRLALMWLRQAEHDETERAATLDQGRQWPVELATYPVLTTADPGPVTA